MKKLALTASVTLAVSLAFAGVFASASNVVDAASMPAPRFAGKVDPVASTIPAQLLTVRCGSKKGDVQFTENELDTLLDLAQKYPGLGAKVCDVFTKRA
jgi:hypothetical protein